ncbi:BON domain-containing protein [Cupriavidus sp. SW-Y-13]|nr:BON domain-containing protein [Cupriavidus sp. SW-Y-13]
MTRGQGGMGGQSGYGQGRGQGGGQGGYGYDLGGSGDMPARKRVGPKGYVRSDDRIREDLCERLTHSGRLDVRDVEVKVSDGVVTLSGSVQDRQQKYRIEDMADEVFGVKEVTNQLRVTRQEGGQGGQWTRQSSQPGLTGQLGQAGQTASQNVAGQTSGISSSGSATGSSASSYGGGMEAGRSGTTPAGTDPHGGTTTPTKSST